MSSLDSQKIAVDATAAAISSAINSDSASDLQPRHSQQQQPQQQQLQRAQTQTQSQAQTQQQQQNYHQPPSSRVSQQRLAKLKRCLISSKKCEIWPFGLALRFFGERLIWGNMNSLPPHVWPENISSTPQRQVRAHFDENHITLFQAYIKEIAEAAVAEQRLNASPLFKMERMTWIKPSFCWALYRSGYTFKDKNQERMLALKMKHKDFAELLSYGVLNEPYIKSRENSNRSHITVPYKTKTDIVRIQWDPERDIYCEKLPFRSIQIGIPVKLLEKFVKEWIVNIQDVTDGPVQIKKMLDMYKDEPDNIAWYYSKGYAPQERPYDAMLPREVRKRIGLPE